MPQRNYLVSTTALSLTQSGTTINSGNTQSGTFVVAFTLVRTSLSAGELASGSLTWSIHYVVSAMVTPYEMRLKLQRRNSSGVMQSESSYGTTRSATGTYDDNITWDSGEWAANDQLALVWEHRRPSGTGNKSGTIDANGSSYVDAPLPPTVVIPSTASVAVTAFSPKLAQAIIPAVAALSLAAFAPTLKASVVPDPATLAIGTLAPKLNHVLVPPISTLTLTRFAPAVDITENVTAIPFTASLTISTLAPVIPSILFADPGGDAVQADGYFGVAQGTGTVSFDTSQKRNGVGSWKCDSGAGNGAAYRKVEGVLGQAGRINFYFRYDSVPDTDEVVSAFISIDTPYSGGGFALGSLLGADDGQYATATPAKNSAQGSTLGDFGLEGGIPETAIIDSIKIIYQRSYSTASSIGVSRVRWLLGAEEGPNHDNANMPTADTVVEVDISADRTWTLADLNSIQIIAEALRGDSDTPHTQSWDYVKVQVSFHTSVSILFGQASNGLAPLVLELLPKGLGVVLRIIDSAIVFVSFFDGITIIPPGEWHRVAVCFVEHGQNDLEMKVFLDGIEELSLDGRSTIGQSWPELLYGWIAPPGANRVCRFDQIYIDDVDDLSDPGPRLMTAKLPATVNADNFDTTGGTGAVNERPVNLTNYKQQAGSSQVLQNYTLQAANVGDVDISDETYIGYMGWAIAKKGTGTGTGAGLTVNGVTTDVTLPTSAGLLKAGVFDVNYPSNAAGIGMRSIDGDADTFLYECGLIEVYHGPPEDILFARYLLLAESSAEVIDDLRASPPSSYMLRYWIWEGGGTVTITAYSITAEGESPRVWSVISNAPGGSGQSRIGVPGIEVRVVIEVSDADTYVMLQGYPNL